MLFLIEKIKNRIWVYIFSKNINKFYNNNSKNKMKLIKFMFFLLIKDEDI